MQKEKIGLYMVMGIGAILILTGIFKVVAANGEAGEEFGSAQAAYILAVIEFITAAAIFIPRTRMLGIILAASYFGGAIVFAWQVEQHMPITQMAISAILYIGAALYRPFLQNNGVTGNT